MFSKLIVCSFQLLFGLACDETVIAIKMLCFIWMHHIVSQVFQCPIVLPGHISFFLALLMGEFLNYRSDFYLQSVEGMKVVCHELAQATSDEEGSVMDELVKDADRLVSCLANKVTIVS